jgi:hypothetical protein
MTRRWASQGLAFQVLDRRLVFTDQVITGPLSAAEVAGRSPSFYEMWAVGLQ